MRRDKEEIKSEIMRRKDEYKVKRVRFWRTMAVSAGSGLACLALVFFLTTRKVPEKTIDANAEGHAADESYAADGAPVENDMQSGGEPAANYGNVTAAPGEKSDEMASDGFYDPGKWICGTPVFEGDEIALGLGMLIDEENYGKLLPALVRTIVAFKDGKDGGEVTRFVFDGAEGERALDLVRDALRKAGVQEAPVEPEDPDCEFVVYFEFADDAGNLVYSRVGVTSENFVLVNDEFCMPRLTDSESIELREALAALCGYEK